MEKGKKDTAKVSWIQKVKLYYLNNPYEITMSKGHLSSSPALHLEFCDNFPPSAENSQE